MTKDNTCFFTGNRILPTGERYIKLTQQLHNEIVNLIENGYENFVAGGAIGFDTLCALSVLNLKSYYPNIRLILVLPCVNQDIKWNEKDKSLYKKIIKKSDETVYISNEYTKGCMHKRNRHMVLLSSIGIAYSTRDSGGTAYTVNYAKENNVKIINLT